MHLLQAELLAESRQSLLAQGPDLSEMAGSLAWRTAVLGHSEGDPGYLLNHAVPVFLCRASLSTSFHTYKLHTALK